VKNLLSSEADHLHLENLRLADAKEMLDLATALVAPNVTITSLVINNFHLKRQNCEKLLSALEYNKTLTLLDLSYTQLNDDISLILFPKLAQNENLKTLILQHNQIHDLGMLFLTDAFMWNTTLTSLDLSYNPYGSVGSGYLTGFLSSNTSLVSLGLRGNCSFDTLRGLAHLIDCCAFVTELDVGGPFVNTIEDVVQSPSSTPSPSLSPLTPTALMVIGAMQQMHRWGRSYSFAHVNCGFLTEDETRVLEATINKASLEDVWMMSGLNPTSIEEKLQTFYLNSNNNDKQNNTFGTVMSINLSHSSLQMIPPHVLSGELISLRSLSLDQNRITGKLSNQISRLTNLTFLDLHQNNLFEIPASISALSQLVTLDLRWNKIKRAGLPPCVFDMRSLQNLRLQGNPLDSLPIDLYTLSSSLDIHVEGTLIPKSLQIILFARSHHLPSLELPHYQIRALPMELALLTSLQTLDLSYNSLVAIPIEIGNLTLLHRLDLRYNYIQNLPWTLGYLPNLNTLLLEGNPLSELPAEIFLSPKQDLSLIKVFLKSLKTGTVQCTRIKVLVVGEENVGKTALIQCLQQYNAKKKLSTNSNPKTISTDGVSIQSLNVDSSLRFSVWDFAGQQVYYNSHHFFITDSSLFIVVFNLADPQPFDRVSYWLQVSRVLCYHFVPLFTTS